MLVEIEIDRADLCLCVGRNVFLDFARTLELLFDGSMQPPLIAFSNELWASHLDTIWDFTASDTNLDPAPNTSRPHLDHDGGTSPLFPEACIERGRLIP